MCHYCYAYYTEYCKYKTYYKGQPFIAVQINYGQRKHCAIQQQFGYRVYQQTGCAYLLRIIPRFF